MTTSPTAYQNFVKGLNYGNHPNVMTYDGLVMHLSLDARVMSPSEAKATINSLISDGAIKKSDRFVSLDNLYDPSKGMYVMKSGKTGRTLKARKPVTSARTVKYIGPGHTQVGYAHRTLDIRFKESKEEYERRKHLRRVHGARKAAKKRNDTIPAVFVDRNDAGMVSFVTSSGKDATYSTKRKADKGRNQIIRKNLKRDAYTTEDMRALLKDDHWEEVAGNKRWMTDNKALVKEFTRYQKAKKRR